MSDSKVPAVDQGEFPFEILNYQPYQSYSYPWIRNKRKSLIEDENLVGNTRFTLSKANDVVFCYAVSILQCQYAIPGSTWVIFGLILPAFCQPTTIDHGVFFPIQTIFIRYNWH
jgi:hypothetical protein